VENSFVIFGSEQDCDHFQEKLSLKNRYKKNKDLASIHIFRAKQSPHPFLMKFRKPLMTFRKEKVPALMVLWLR